jgi:hypothetical protein
MSALVAGVRETTGHLSGRQTAADTSPATDASLATCAGHQPSGRRSFRKQRTVNPLMASTRYNFLYSPQGRPAGGRLRRPSSAGRTAASCSSPTWVRHGHPRSATVGRRSR